MAGSNKKSSIGKIDLSQQDDDGLFDLDLTLSAPSAGEKVMEIPVEQIIYDSDMQSRDPFDPEGNDKELIESIATDGLDNPIVVRQVKEVNGTIVYKLVSGHKRTKVHQHLKKTKILATVRPLSDSPETNLFDQIDTVKENNLRDDLPPYHRLIQLERMINVYKELKKLGLLGKYNKEIIDENGDLKTQKITLELFLSNYKFSKIEIDTLYLLNKDLPVEIKGAKTSKVFFDIYSKNSTLPVSRMFYIKTLLMTSPNIIEDGISDQEDLELVINILIKKSSSSVRALIDEMREKGELPLSKRKSLYALITGKKPKNYVEKVKAKSLPTIPEMDFTEEFDDEAEILELQGKTSTNKQSSKSPQSQENALKEQLYLLIDQAMPNKKDSTVALLKEKIGNFDVDNSGYTLQEFLQIIGLLLQTRNKLGPEEKLEMQNIFRLIY